MNHLKVFETLYKEHCEVSDLLSLVTGHWFSPQLQCSGFKSRVPTATSNSLSGVQCRSVCVLAGTLECTQQQHAYTHILLYCIENRSWFEK